MKTSTKAKRHVHRFYNNLGIHSESSLLLWQGPITSIIRNVLCSIGCFFIISRAFLRNMRIVLKRSTDISGRSSRMLLRSISTAAIRCVGLLPFGVQTFGDRINFHPHIHVLVTEGGTAPDGTFHHVSRFHDEVIQELFTHEVFSLLVRKKLIGVRYARPVLRSPIPLSLKKSQTMCLPKAGRR